MSEKGRKPTFGEVFELRNLINHYIHLKMALEFNDSNFEELVLKSEELAKDFDGKAVIGKLNVDENMSVSAQFGIRNIPTLLVFKNGEVVDKQVGVAPKNVLADKITAQL